MLMLKNSSSDRAENANPTLTMFFGPADVFQIWLPVMSAAFELNGKIFEIAATLNNACLNLVSRQLAEHIALQQELGRCTDFCGVYDDFVQKAVDGYRAEIRRDAGAVIDGSGSARRSHGDEDDHA
jgi:hypothetical protein